MKVTFESPDQPDVVALIDELDAYQKPLYPAESHHGVDLGVLLRPEVAFAVARDESGRAIGCGAVMAAGTVGELKRMFVRPGCRGRGVAKALLSLLEAEALRRGCGWLMLETGVRQPEALGLYERAGFRRRGPFGDYGPDPLSVFMEKPLREPAGPILPAS
jgi:putative acetyltransferase